MKKDLLKGVALSSAAAYIFAALLMLGISPGGGGSPREAVVGALFIFTFPPTLAFVVLTGALLGVITPRLFAGSGRFAALFGGALLGLAAGFVGARLGFGFPAEFSLLTGVYCAPWTAAYACRRRRDPVTLP